VVVKTLRSPQKKQWNAIPMNKNLRVLIEGTQHYFKKLTGEAITVDKPQLIREINQHILDYTGVIGISGSHQGSIFFSSTKGLLEELLLALKITDDDENQIMDLVGDVSNTISGNARCELGAKFMVSPPVILKGKGEEMKVSHIEEIYMIPLLWKGHKAHLIISLEG
jgi:chemotaxis protein CheX